MVEVHEISAGDIYKILKGSDSLDTAKLKSKTDEVYEMLNDICAIGGEDDNDYILNREESIKFQDIEDIIDDLKRYIKGEKYDEDVIKTYIKTLIKYIESE